MYTHRESEMESVVKRIFALIWGQYSQGLKSTLKHMKDYEIKVIECDVVWHLKYQGTYLQIRPQD